MSFVLPGLLGETSVLDLSFRWSPTYSVALIGAGALALSLLSSTLGWHKRAPGPRPLPIFGNIFDFDIAQPWHTFTKWKTAYGDVIGLRAPGTNILVLNSLQAITDLLDKRGPMYSHRPVFTVVGELMGLDNSLPLMEYGPEYRNARKLMHLALNPAAIKRYEIMQEDFAALLARDLLDTPRDFFDHIRLTAGRIILSVSYGLDVQTADSKYIAHAEDTMKLISESTVPGAYLADFIPTMKYLPSWLSFQKRAVEGKEMIERLVTAPYEHVKRDMVQAEGIARPSLTHQLLLDNEGSLTPETDHLLKWTVGALYGAGGETTYATTLVNIMAMALNPEKQRLAQAEIDRVLGGERLPVIADRSRLPYVDAVVKETMRWHPSLPLGIARRVAEDDVYEGYNIPKGTVVMPNAWAIALADDAKYPPEQFIPERFLDTEHKTVDPAVYSFGWGRRVCPGKALGEGNVFILISTILAVFTLLPPEDEPLQVEFTPNLVSYPKPFRCRIIPRSQEIAETVRRRATQGTV